MNCQTKMTVDRRKSFISRSFLLELNGCLEALEKGTHTNHKKIDDAKNSATNGNECREAERRPPPNPAFSSIGMALPVRDPSDHAVEGTAWRDRSCRDAGAPSVWL